MAWYSLAIGAVVGPDAGTGADGAGGAKSGGDDDSGAQGMFSAFGHQIWLYIGGIMGWGKKAGPYVTAGPMIGADMDFAVGGGVHLGRRFGLGMVIPLRAALVAGSQNEQVGYLMDKGSQLAHAVSEPVMHFGSAGLEAMVASPATPGMAVASGILIGATEEGRNSIKRMYRTTVDLYKSGKNKLINKIYGIK